MMSSLSQSLPFILTGSLPDTLADCSIQVVLTGENLQDASLPADKLFRQFATAANAGMFAGERVSPLESLFEIVSREDRSSQTSYQCRVRGVDLGAFRIFLNILAVSSQRFKQLQEVSLCDLTFSRSSKPVEGILLSPFPGKSDSVPFGLNVRQGFFENREPLIRMEFQRNLQDEEFDQIKAIIEAWDMILTLGGYGASPFAEQTTLNKDPREFFELFLVEPRVLEHLVYAFDGPEESFNPIINMAVKLHFKLCPLAALDLE